MIGLLALAAVVSSPVYLECPLSSAGGSPVLWRLTLNEQAGTADVTIGDQEPQRLKATFYPETVRFYVGSGPVPRDIRGFASSLPGMRMDVSRVNLKIARYSQGEGNAPDYGQCKRAKAQPLAF